MPVITSVIVMVVSIDPQFDASGVACHGLRKWNKTDTTTIATKITAKVIWIRPRLLRAGALSWHSASKANALRSQCSYCLPAGILESHHSSYNYYQVLYLFIPLILV